MEERTDGRLPAGNRLPVPHAEPVPSGEPGLRPPWEDEPMQEGAEERLPAGGLATVSPPMPEPSHVARRVENLDDLQQAQEGYAAAREGLEPLTPRTQMDQSGEIPRPSWDERYREELYSPVLATADLQYRLFPAVAVRYLAVTMSRQAS